MTAVIVANSSEGIVLVNDCLCTVYSSEKEKKYTKQVEKLRIFTYSSNNLTTSFSGIAIVSPGLRDRLMEMLSDRTFLEKVEEEHNYAQQLTSSDAFDMSDEELKRKALSGIDDEWAEVLRGAPIRGFVTDTLLEDRNKIMVRFSSDLPPDILHIYKGQIKKEGQYLVDGSGRTIIEPLLKREFRPQRSLEENIQLCSRGLNAILRDQERYRGYQILVVDYRNEELQRVMLAEDINARQIDPVNLVFSDIYSKSQTVERQT